MGKRVDLRANAQKFFGSLLGALAGVGFIGLSVHLGASNDFLANLFLKGGGFFEYLLAAAVLGSFALGVVLIARHVAREGVAEYFYEQTPY